MACSRFCSYVVGVIGIVFSVIAFSTCDFVRYRTYDGETLTADLPPPFVQGSGSVGLLLWDNQGGCEVYDTFDYFDDFFETAASASLVAAICACLALLIASVECIFCDFCCSKFFILLAFILAMVAQGFTFFLFEAENFCSAGRYCVLGNSGIYSIVAGSLYLFTSILVCSTPNPVPCCKKSEEVADRNTAEEEKAESETKQRTPVDPPSDEISVAEPAAAATNEGALDAAHSAV